MFRNHINTKAHYRLIFCSAILILGTICNITEARPVLPRLPEKVREAEVIIYGNISSVEGTHIQLIVEKSIKGAFHSSKAQLKFEDNSSIELSRPKLKQGDKIWVFGSLKNGEIEPSHGWLGIVLTKKENEEAYESTVRSIVSYNIAVSTVARVDILKTMLQGNEFAQDTALFVIYQEAYALSDSELIQHVVRLSKQPNHKIAGPAIQVLGKIGDKAEIPALIELLGSSNKYIVEASYGAIKRMTGAKMSFNSTKSAEERKADVRQWQEWWGKNKDKVKIRR